MVEKIKILITGSSGMLGLSLCKALADEYEVFGLDLLATRSFTQCDITDKDKLVATVKSVKPDLIIHTAGYTDVDGSEQNPKQAFAVNAGGTENISRAAKKLGAILFYISTDYVFDGKKDRPYTETDIPRPINIYGQSKLEGERTIQALLEKHFILRTSWLFGPNGRNFVTTFLQKTKGNKTLPIVNDQIGSPTYTLDLAGAIKTLLSILNSSRMRSLKEVNLRDPEAIQKKSLHSGKPSANLYGIYHITNSGSCSWHEFAQEIISIKQLHTRILPITSLESMYPAQRPGMSVLDNSKLMLTFKLRLRPWKEALNHFLLNYT